MKALLIQQIQLQLSELLNRHVAITGHQPVYGGDINTTFILRSDEAKWFVKINRSEYSAMFEKEFAGLKLLQNKSALKIPDPLLSGAFESDCFLVMECLDRGNPSVQTGKQSGAGLADLHRHTQLQFGLSDDNFIGRLPQSNCLTDTWAEFYANQRILPLLQSAFDKNLCTTSDIKEGEKLGSRFNDLFPDEPPALLHGDLWSGNVMVCANEEVAIFDPAIYYGNREMDIAMTLLFGGFDESFYHHYNENYPLQTGWQQRVALCQLYPLLVHLILFGGNYYSRVKAVLNKYA